MSVHERPFLAPRLGLDAARVDAVTHEVLLARLGAPVAEREVVFVRAALVAVPVDPDAEVGVGLQDGDLLVERPGVVRANVRLDVVEMDHRRQHGAHGLGGAPECGQRIGLARPRLAVRFLTRPAGLLLPRQTLGLGLRCRGRVGVGLRGQLLDGLFPAARAGDPMPSPDFQFPQTATAGLAAPGWRPRFPDHLYVAFTSAVAFSPTDTMPLTIRAKAPMALQSLISLAVVVVVLARVINILPT